MLELDFLFLNLWDLWYIIMILKFRLFHQTWNSASTWWIWGTSSGVLVWKVWFGTIILCASTLAQVGYFIQILNLSCLILEFEVTSIVLFWALLLNAILLPMLHAFQRYWCCLLALPFWAAAQPPSATVVGHRSQISMCWQTDMNTTTLPETSVAAVLHMTRSCQITL